MTAPVLVTGGTGALGRLVVERLQRTGREVRVLSRRSQAASHGVRFVVGDLTTGDGVGPAVEGVTAIVHCASNRTGDAAATRNLVRAAAARADHPHLVYISIVGVDRVRWGYFRAKLEAEHVVAGSGLPWTTLRATQFHDLILRGARKLTRLPVVPVPARFLVQPVDAADVATRLVTLTLGRPAGRVPDLGGPRVSTFAELIHAYLRAAHRRRPVLPVPMPGLGPVRAGALLPASNSEAATGRTWEEYLVDELT